MDKEFFMNAGFSQQLQYEHQFGSSMPTWQSLSTSMEIQNTQTPDCFLTTPPPNDHFESALSSMVSSPGASNSVISNDNFMIRELIGKLGSICSSNDMPSYINGGNCSTNNSCYSTPLNSPPKMGISIPIMDHLVNEKFPSLGNSIGLSSNLPAMPSDPGFAERAARFSSFGSRSCNGRTTSNQFGLHNNNNHKNSEQRSCSNLSGRNGKLQRVSSSPSLKVDANQGENIKNGTIEEKQSGLKIIDQGELPNSNENSVISGQNQVGEIGSSRKRKSAASKGKGKQTESTSQIPTNSTKGIENLENPKAKRSRSEESNGDEIDEAKTEENREDDNKKQNQKPPEAPKDYIHVRARRGQATDSHSLAERVRREKISERMKLLQDLVPGCNKVTGKALMLDEIINYVQSLQRQVEFLSMKLSTVNPRIEMNMGTIYSKDEIQPNCSMPHPMYQALYGHQNPLQDSITTAGATNPSPMDPLNPTINNNHSLHLPPNDAFSNCLPQLSSLCQGDLQSIVQMGYGQSDQNGFQAQSLHGTNNNPTPMKIEF